MPQAETLTGIPVVTDPLETWLEGHWWESLSDVHAGVPALPAAGSKLHMVAAWYMPEGSSPGLLGFSRIPNGVLYVSVDTAVKLVEQLGRGTLLAKVDIRSAYRMLPIHPDDRWLLGMRWEGSVFVGAALPFGLPSAPKIFTAVADASLPVGPQSTMCT